MQERETSAQRLRRQAYDDVLGQRFLPFWGLMLAALLLYGATSFISADGRLEVHCSGRRMQILCDLTFGVLQTVLPGRATNVVYSLLFAFAGSGLAFLSLRRVFRRSREPAQNAS